MKRHKSKIISIIALTVFVCVGWFVPFEYHNEGYCSESPLYRYRLGIYACEYNDEAGPGIQCSDKLGGFWAYIGLQKLECELKAAQVDKKIAE